MSTTTERFPTAATFGSVRVSGIGCVQADGAVTSTYLPAHADPSNAAAGRCVARDDFAALSLRPYAGKHRTERAA
jgi:hypothetical protein